MKPCPAAAVLGVGMTVSVSLGTATISPTPSLPIAKEQTGPTTYLCSLSLSLDGDSWGAYDGSSLSVRSQKDVSPTPDATVINLQPGGGWRGAPGSHPDIGPFPFPKEIVALR